MSVSPSSPNEPTRSPRPAGAGAPEPSVAPLKFLVWAVVIVSVITVVAALATYSDLPRSSAYTSVDAQIREAQVRAVLGWWVLFTAAYAGLGARLARLETATRPGEPRALYWTAVAVAAFHLVVAGWLLNGAWGNWMDVVAFLLPGAVLGVLSTVGVRSALLGS